MLLIWIDGQTINARTLSDTTIFSQRVFDAEPMDRIRDRFPDDLPPKDIKYVGMPDLSIDEWMKITFANNIHVLQMRRYDDKYEYLGILQWNGIVTAKVVCHDETEFRTKGFLELFRSLIPVLHLWHDGTIQSLAGTCKLLTNEFGLVQDGLFLTRVQLLARKYWSEGVKWRTYPNPQREDGLFIKCHTCSVPYQLPHVDAEELVRLLNGAFRP